MSGAADYRQVRVEVVQHLGPEAAVLLHDSEDRHLVMQVGTCEAAAIAQQLDPEFDPPRPSTQGFALGLFRRLEATVTALHIDDFWEGVRDTSGVYYGKLTLTQAGDTLQIDCRPSDGIALALAAKAPIYVAERFLREPQGADDDDDFDDDDDDQAGDEDDA